MVQWCAVSPSWRRIYIYICVCVCVYMYVLFFLPRVLLGENHYVSEQRRNRSEATNRYAVESLGADLTRCNWWGGLMLRPRTTGCRHGRQHGTSQMTPRTTLLPKDDVRLRVLVESNWSLQLPLNFHMNKTWNLVVRESHLQLPLGKWPSSFDFEWNIWNPLAKVAGR